MPAERTFEFEGTDRFEILRRLGEGGMGVVYEAYDREQSTRVALKTLRRLDAQSLYRFKNEFRSLEAIEHPNLVSLGELFEASGEWFFTMELVDGVDFLEYVRKDDESSRMKMTPGDSSTGDVSGNEPTMDASGVGGDSLLSLGAAAPVVQKVHGTGFREDKLRAALGQIVSGLHAMHAAGKVHRDIKPSNIRVAREDGRVVILDFGLVTEMTPAPHSEEQDVVGTAAYMAPEQAAAKNVGPEADWYSVGIMLYRALTGQLPFTGRPMEIFYQKQQREPPAPRELVPDVPLDLSNLCRELLRFEPEARPNARRLLDRLGVADGAAPLSISSTSEFTEMPAFVGREQELDVLHQAFEDTRRGGAVTVVVNAESGVGKTALLREFTEQLRGQRSDLVTLAGRCYERETVPYKAFDGVVDALSQYMRQLPKEESSALVPRFASLLPRVFPVLGRVEVIAQAPRPRRAIPDPQELRGRAFQALREVLLRLSELHPVVITIDDLQWADTDSLHLLGDLLRPPDEPPLLLLVSSRTGWVDLETVIPQDVRQIELGPLPAERARELTQLLLSRAKVDAMPPGGIADEAQGHPLFIAELVRHAAMSGTFDASLRLDEAIWSRVSQLPPEALHILELVAVAGARLPRDVLGDAAEVAPAVLNKQLSLLRVAHLARGAGGKRGRVEPYHDRVREAVTSHLSLQQRAQRHRRLAVALEGAGFANEQPELLVRHLEAAGEDHRAAEYAHAAAERARSVFAFDRAAELTRVALRMPSLSAEEACGLQRVLGDDLAFAGRGREAAKAYLAAADGANPAETLDLHRRAAEQLLRSGHIDDGLTEVESVLAAVNMRLPKTPMRALASLLWRRARLRLRGLRFKERDETQISQEQLRRIDICWGTAVGLSMVDPIRGSDFQTRHLLLALKAGEPYRIARALALEASFAATPGGKATRAHRLAEEARQLSQRIDHPHAIGMSHFATGTVAHFVGRWKDAQDGCEAAEETYRERCTGVAWEIDTVQLFQLWSRTQMGGFGAMGERVSRWLGEAEKRGNLYMATYLRASFVPYLHLVQGRPDTARKVLGGAMKGWSQSGLHMQHVFHLFLEGLVDLYEGTPEHAFDRWYKAWPELQRALILQLQTVRALLGYLVASSAIGAAANGTRDRKLMLRIARKHLRKLRRERVPWIDSLAILVRAQLALAEGDKATALRYLNEGIEALERFDMLLFAAAARRWKGILVGGNKGTELVTGADAWMTAEQIQNPTHMSRMMTPGFAESEQKLLTTRSS